MSGSGNQIANNSVGTNTLGGILVSNTTVSLTGNIVSGNQNFGISLATANENTLNQNQIFGNSSHGLIINGSDNNINNNTIYNNGVSGTGAGVFIESGNNNSILYNSIYGNAILGMESIFRAGFKEFSRLAQQSEMDSEAIIEGARRAMRVATMREEERLERHLAFLASVGSTSPYIGLFGTVWGIMHSFRGLANATQATLATVAPGISEALVATAMGLFAAIPAVMAYNRFASRVDVFTNRYDTFVDEFSSILYRQAYSLKSRDRKAS